MMVQLLSSILARVMHHTRQRFVLLVEMSSTSMCHAHTIRTAGMVTIRALRDGDRSRARSRSSHTLRAPVVLGDPLDGGAAAATPKPARPKIFRPRERDRGADPELTCSRITITPP